MTCRDSAIFHAFFDSPTADRHRLRAELTSGRTNVKVTFKRRRYDADAERYRWCEPLEFKLPADRATTHEALMVAREQETGQQRPPQLQKPSFASCVGTAPMCKAAPK